jgi:hypothetical protein
MIAAGHQGHGPPDGVAGAGHAPATLHTLLVVLIFSAMNFGKYFGTGFVLKVLPIDLLLVALLIYTSLARRFRFRLGGGLFILFAFMALNIACEILSVIAIDGGAPENISLGVALVRNAVLIFIVAQLDYDYQRTRRWLMAAGAAFSLIAIAGWLNAIRNYAQIAASRSLHDPQIFYVFSEGQLRLQGLREDPNFFFIINLIPLVMGISLIRERRALWPVVGTGLILAASVLTFSRSGALLLGLLVFFLFVGDLTRFNVRRLFLTVSAIVLIVVGARFVSDAYGLPDVGQIMTARFERGTESGGSGRTRLWAGAWDGFTDAVVFGQGGRYTYRTYGQYAHNDYLEMLSSHGLVGFALMAGMWLYVVAAIASRYLAARLVPLFSYSALCFLIMLGASFFFTIYYNPYIWFLVALIFTVKEDEGAGSR